METKPSSKYKIRFIDCDPLGHLTNSRFIDYMLNAREDHVNVAYGLDYKKLAEKTGGSWVTIQNQIAYLKEVRYGEEVIIDSKLIRFSEKKATVEIRMWNEQQSELKSLLWTEVIYFNLLTRRSEAQPEDIRAMFKQVLVEIPETHFSERIQNILLSK